MHFFAPVTKAPLIELVRSADTSDATHAALGAFVASLDKLYISAPDAPGFLLNAIFLPMLVNAVRQLQSGSVQPEAIDMALRLTFGLAIGPMALADFIGLDVMLRVAQNLRIDGDGGGDDVLRLMGEMVARGELGRKSGKGFYDYAKKKAKL